jgi:predicted nuclease of restriction endonuclease-like (RecB) superfamily
MCRVEGWSTRLLARKVSGMLYERTALSKKPEETIRQELAVLREKGDVSPALVFQDPYMLDFLQLADTYSEKDLESAILREIERFVLELGSGFLTHPVIRRSRPAAASRWSWRASVLFSFASRSAGGAIASPADNGYGWEAPDASGRSWKPGSESNRRADHLVMFPFRVRTTPPVPR